MPEIFISDNDIRVSVDIKMLPDNTDGIDFVVIDTYGRCPRNWNIHIGVDSRYKNEVTDFDTRRTYRVTGVPDISKMQAVLKEIQLGVICGSEINKIHQSFNRESGIIKFN